MLIGMDLLDKFTENTLALLANPWVALINILLLWQFALSDYYGMLDAENKTAIIATTIGAAAFILLFIAGAVKITGIKPIIADWVKERIGHLTIVEITLFIVFLALFICYLTVFLTATILNLQKLAEIILTVIGFERDGGLKILLIIVLWYVITFTNSLWQRKNA